MINNNEIALERLCGIKLKTGYELCFTTGRLVQSIESTEEFSEFQCETKSEITLKEVILVVYLADSKGVIHEYKIKDFLLL